MRGTYGSKRPTATKQEKPRMAAQSHRTRQGKTQDAGPFEAQGKLKARHNKGEENPRPTSKNEDGPPGEEKIKMEA